MPHSAAPNPAYVPGFVPYPRSSRMQASVVIIRGLLVICSVVILIETIMIICRSDALRGLLDLDSAARRASNERSALLREREQWELQGERFEQERTRWERERVNWEHEGVMLEQDRVRWEQERVRWEQERIQWAQERVRWEHEGIKWKKEGTAWKQERLKWEQEREESEREREKMRRDRELWEKAREDRVPQGAFWDVVQPAPACHAYGKREYWATLQNIPEGWTAADACMNMPVEIRGVTVRRPYRCAFVDESPHIRGYWMVDWDQPDCRPWWRNYQDAVCTNRPLFTCTFAFTHFHRDAPAINPVPVESRVSSSA